MNNRQHKSTRYIIIIIITIRVHVIIHIHTHVLCTVENIIGLVEKKKKAHAHLDTHIGRLVIK